MNKPIRRFCQLVISEMLEKIPKSEKELIKDLKWNFEDSCYKAPEETLQWERTATTLQKHIPKPFKDWHFEIISIFTKKPIETLIRIKNEQI